MSTVKTNSPTMLEFLAWMEGAHRPYTVRQIAEASGISVSRVRDCCQKMRHLGVLANMAAVSTGPGEYILSSKVDKKQATPPPHRASCFEGPPMEWKYAQPARKGATDHESIPSRRADGYKPHMPMMLMGSGVRGEAGR